MHMEVNSMNWLSIRTPLRRSDVDSLEKELRIKLPDDYKEQIGPINGGALRDTYIVVPRLEKVPYSRNVALNKGARAGIYDLLPIFNNETITLFPFARVGNGDYFCFDLETNTVVLYLHELQSTRYVCDSFTQLMEYLIKEDS